MIYQLTKGIADQITGDWTDRKTGLVVLRTIGEKRLPFASDLYETDCAVDKVVSPDSKYKSVLYFEYISAPTFENVGAGVVKINASVRLVVWLNGLKLGDKSPVLSSRVMNDLIRQFKYNKFAVSGFDQIKVELINQEQKDERLFTKYSDSGSVNYTMSPYDFFSCAVRIRAVVGCDTFEIGDPVC